LGLLQQQVNELQKSTDLEITAAEERGKQMGLGEKEAHLKVLREKLNMSCLLRLAQNRCSPFNHQAEWAEKLRIAENTQQVLLCDSERKFKMEHNICQVGDSDPGYTCQMLTYLANSQRVSEELRIATEKLNTLNPTSLSTVDDEMEIDDAPTATVRVH